MIVPPRISPPEQTQPYIHPTSIRMEGKGLSLRSTAFTTPENPSTPLPQTHFYFFGIQGVLGSGWLLAGCQYELTLFNCSYRSEGPVSRSAPSELELAPDRTQSQQQLSAASNFARLAGFTGLLWRIKKPHGCPDVSK